MNSKISKVALSPKSYMQNHVFINPDSVLSCKKKKVIDKDFTVPNFDEHEKLLRFDYKISLLKQICNHYRLKKSGSKQQLRFSVYNHLLFSNKIIPIQRMVRGYIARKLWKLKGMQYRLKCVNDTDFLSLDNINTIPYSQIFAFKDSDGCVWGFDIRSIREWIVKSKSNMNPYTRGELPISLYDTIRHVIKLQGILKMNTDLTIMDYVPDNNLKNIELRVHKLFQTIDEYGNYTDASWFLSLGRNNLIRFTRELYDLWHYRLGLSNVLRRNIVPTGDPFRTVNLHQIIHADMDILKKSILCILEKFVNTGIDREHKYLGSTYVLTALTTVSPDAAVALPWLYHSVI
jgi:hypothetical protein